MKKRFLAMFLSVTIAVTGIVPARGELTEEPAEFESGLNEDSDEIGDLLVEEDSGPNSDSDMNTDVVSDPEDEGDPENVGTEDFFDGDFNEELLLEEDLTEDSIQVEDDENVVIVGSSDTEENPYEENIIADEFSDDNPGLVGAVVASGQCGDNLTCTLDSEDVLTIRGTGNMWDFTYREAPWDEWYFKLGIEINNITLVIEDGVTSIGKCAFYDPCLGVIRSISIGNSVKRIEDQAFRECEYLTSIIIPDSVIDIGSRAFLHCDSLSNVIIGKNVTNIGYEAFEYCSSLKNIEIVNNVMTIESDAFSHCEELETITLGRNIRTIGSYAFYYCPKLRDIYYEGSEEEWNLIKIESGNGWLTDATIHYSSQATTLSFDSSNYDVLVGDKFTVQATWLSDSEPNNYSWGNDADGLQMTGKTVQGPTSSNGKKKYIFTATYTAKMDGDYYVDLEVLGNKARTLIHVKNHSFDIADADVSGLGTFYYTGKKVKPNPVVRLNGLVLLKDTDYTLSYKSNKKVGTAKITIKGKGIFTGKKTVSFKIKKQSIKEAAVSGIDGYYKYTNKAIKPVPTVYLNGKKLKNKTDYKVSYKNNKKVGTATVTINGKGIYEGKTTIKFSIINTVSADYSKAVSLLLSGYVQQERAIQQKGKIIVDDIGNLYQELENNAVAPIERSIDTTLGSTLPINVERAFIKKFTDTIKDTLIVKPSSYDKCKNPAQLVNKVASDIKTSEGRIAFSFGKTQYTATFNSVNIVGAAYISGTITDSNGRSYIFGGTQVSNNDISAEMELLKIYAQSKIDEAKKAVIDDATKLIIPENLKAFLKAATKDKAYGELKKLSPKLADRISKAEKMATKFSDLKKAYYGLNSLNLNNCTEEEVVKRINNYNKKIEAFEKAVAAFS